MGETVVQNGGVFAVHLHSRWGTVGGAMCGPPHVRFNSTVRCLQS
jgi:hypothetical protein